MAMWAPAASPSAVPAPPGLEAERSGSKLGALSAALAELTLTGGLAPNASVGIPARVDLNGSAYLGNLANGLSRNGHTSGGLGSSLTNGLTNGDKTKGSYTKTNGSGPRNGVVTNGNLTNGNLTNGGSLTNGGADGLAAALQQQQQQQLLLQLLQHAATHQHPQPQASNSSGEWFNAVLTAAPFMDADGLKEALAILDKAVSNIQQIKALDGIISSTYMAGGIFTAMPHLHAAEHMKAQIFEQQQILLRQLHHLRACTAAVPGQALTPAAAAGLMEQMKSSQQRAQQQSLQQLGSSLLTGDDRLRSLHAYLQQQHDHQRSSSEGGNTSATLPAQRRRVGQAAPDSQQPLSHNMSTTAQRNARQGAARHVQTLSTSLQLLANEEPDCLFIVRRINKLGFKADRKLKHYFSSCGNVVRVLVAHSTVRQHGDPQCHPRRRPSSLGFVHMSTAEAVRRVLALGDEQTVENCVIRVQKFERQRHDEFEDEEDDQDEEQERDTVEELKDESWKRQQSAISTKSTFLEVEDEEWKRQQSAISAKSTGSADSTYSAFEGSLVEESSEQ